MSVAVKAGALALALFSLVSATPAPPPQPMIPKVVCPTVFAVSMGTAFRVSPHLLVSVRHVTNWPVCEIDGQAIKSWNDPDKDFSLIADDRAGPFLKVDCGGFVKGRKYIAVGHARGLDQLTIVEMIATGITRGGFYALSGIFTVVPGQSGGPIIDAETGKVVGTVNTYDAANGLSGSIELKGTALCHG